MVRAAVTAGGTNTWGEELALPVTEFVGAVNERSVPGRLANLRRVPLNVRTVTETSSSTGYWVGEGAAKPVSKMAYTNDVLEPFKVSALVVVTDEVLRSSSPNAEAVVRNDLLNAVVRELNSAFIDEGNAGISGVMPASVTNGLTPISGSGDLADDLAVFCWPTSREISKRQHSSDTRSFCVVVRTKIIPASVDVAACFCGFLCRCFELSVARYVGAARRRRDRLRRR